MTAKQQKKGGRPKNEPGTKRVKENFTISPAAKAALRAEAKKSGLSMSAVVEQCIRKQLSDDK